MKRQFINNVYSWIRDVFGEPEDVESDRATRSRRFIEEAIELVQACGTPKEEVATILEYVYSRPKGEIQQEVGGVMVTLAGHASIFGYDPETCGNTELNRIRKIDPKKILLKNLSKPHF